MPILEGMRRSGWIFLLAWGLLYGPLYSCSAISDFVENREGGRKFNTSNPVFDKYIYRFEKYGQFYKKDKYFHVGDIPINFGDTENPLFDGVCFSYSNGEKEIIIKKSWWDRHEKKEVEEENQDDKDIKDEAKEVVESTEKDGEEGEEEEVVDAKNGASEDKEKKESYSLIQESLIFHELGHCRLGRQHLEESFEKGLGFEVKKSMMSHNIVTSNDYRKYKEGYWEELFTGSTEKLENLIKK